MNTFKQWKVKSQQALQRSKSAESFRTIPVNLLSDEEESSESDKSEEDDDHLTPLIKAKKNTKVNRSISLDSDPNYQLFLYGTSTPFFLLNKKVTKEPYKQSSFITIFAIWNTIIGSSLLAMPWCVQRAGLPLALIFMLVISSLAVYTAYRLLGVQIDYGNNDVGEVPYLCRTLLGSWAELLSRVCSFAIIFGANIVYWILMSNFLYYLVNYLIDVALPSYQPAQDYILNETVLCPRRENVSVIENDQKSIIMNVWSLHGTVPIFLVTLVVPLLNFKSPTFFTKFNSLGVLSVIYLVIFVACKSAVWGINLNYDNGTNFYEGTFAASSGMLPLSLFIHNIIITLMRSNRNKFNHGRDLSIAYLLVVLTYIVIGFTFYACFPLPKDCIEDNMLNNFPSNDIMTVVARIFLLFQLLTVFPLLSYMLRIQIFSALNYPSYPSALHVTVLNLICVTICVIFAIYFPHIGIVIRFTGAICGFVYIFTLPNLLYLASKKQKNDLSLTAILIHTTIPLIGLINVIAQFFVSD